MNGTHKTSIVRYLVTIATPQGQAELEVPSTLGQGAAERRAIHTAYAMRWADIGEAHIVSARVLAPGE